MRSDKEPSDLFKRPRLTTQGRVDMDKTTPIFFIERDLVPFPVELAKRRNSGVTMVTAPEVVEHLEIWHRLMVEAGGDPAGVLVVNSAYRRRGVTCMNDIGGRIDLSDINGHWTGRAVDFSARQTANTFWPPVARTSRRDIVRAKLYEAGFFYPWYWKAGIVGGQVLEHWHVGIEVQPWTQKNAFRGETPPWYA